MAFNYFKRKQSWSLGNIINAISKWPPDPFQSFQNPNIQVASLFSITVNLGKVLNISVPQLSHLFLENGESPLSLDWHENLLGNVYKSLTVGLYVIYLKVLAIMFYKNGNMPHTLFCKLLFCLKGYSR